MMIESDTPYIAHDPEEPEILPVLPALILCFGIVAIIILVI